jgi:Domain of unknown function (DUF6259)
MDMASRLVTMNCWTVPARVRNRTEGIGRSHSRQRVAWGSFAVLLFVLLICALPLSAAESGGKLTGTWPQEYAVQRDDVSGRLTLSTPYYTVQHDLKRGGAIAGVRLTHGSSTNLLVQPITTRIQHEGGTVFTDLRDTSARVSHRKDGLTEIVTVACRLLDDKGRASDIQVRTVFEYHWGYIKIRREFTSPAGSIRAREVCPFSVILTPSLSDYGYREGTTEQEGAPPFSFGSNRWGKLRRQNPADRPLRTPFVPRSMLFADAGIEGLEWFVGSDLSQWDLQLAGRRGQGLCLFQLSEDPPGLALSVSPLFSTNAAVVLPKTCVFDFYLGIPLIQGHALPPWLHTSFNRNRGDWVAPEQIRRWADTGIQTVHCHNDGDYYDDGLFWRDGSYPPYPDMEKYNKVIRDCHQAGIRVATYFSNKELHPSTREFRAHGSEWARMNSRGSLQHNFFHGTNEFGAQMCLRSGWLEFLKLSIDRVLKNHPLDGVYYDWNVALYCCNGLHEGKKAGEVASGHWDIDELLDLMEWTRRRVGPGGLVIVHNTTTPMFTTENFADYVVANEWGYGTWKDGGPGLQELPLEWSLVGARPRGVISYGQLDAQSPKRLHRLFALEALLGGVTPWPASSEAFELASILKPLGDIKTYRFADWRNQAVTLDGSRCASAIYSRPGESYVLLGNLEKDPQEVRCVVHPERLPYPPALPVAATVFRGVAGADQDAEKAGKLNLNIGQLMSEGVKVTIPADSAVLLHIQ